MMKTPSLIVGICAAACSLWLLSCGTRDKFSEEQIPVGVTTVDEEQDTVNAVKGGVTMKQIPSYPHKVVMTGYPEHRLVTIYKIMVKQDSRGSSSFYYDYDDYDREFTSCYMPGIDLIQGYNLLNVAHHNMNTGKLSLLFDHPVLVKSLYFPSYVQDSLDNKPVNRNYYLVSAYDEDTNRDSLINKQDLRRFYWFDREATSREQLIPADYSVERSQYDPKNDAMYIFARQDKNGDGHADDVEPLQIFWISLKNPAQAKRLY